MRGFAAAVVMLAACGDNLAGPADGHLFDGRVWGGNLAVADGWVYFSTYGEQDDGEHHALWRVRPDGGAAVPIWVAPRGIFGFGLAVGDGKLYWSEAVDRQDTALGVFEVDATGGAETQLGTFATINAPYMGVSFDGGHVYAGNEDDVLDIPVPGGTQTTAYTGGLSWMVHRGGHLYVLANKTLLADSAPLATLQAPTGRFDVDDHAAYVGDGDSLRRIPFDTTTTASSIPVNGKPVVITVGPEQIYAIVDVADGEELDRFDFATGVAHTITNQIHTVFALATDDTSVYAAACCDNGYVTRFDL